MLALAFNRRGDKILTRCKTPLKATHGGELRASQDSKWIHFITGGHVIYTYVILNGRSLDLRCRYIFKQKELRPKPLMIGTLTHIFPYKDSKVIGLLDYGKKHDLKFMVFSYKEGKIDTFRHKVKNVDAFTFRGEVKFYRKNDKIYFYDQKGAIYRLTL